MQLSQLYTIYLQYPSVQTDTRKLQQQDIYFALKGKNYNGNEYTKKAFEAGASYCVIDEQAFMVNDKCILVENVLQTLQQLALHHRKQFSIPFIAITGSNGKTTTKELVHSVLKTTYKTYATVGNLNNQIGIPLTLLSIKQDAEIAIIEMGANHQKEIEDYCTYTLPTHGLITNCGKAHLEGFGDVNGVKKSKGELYAYMRNTQGTIFINKDYDYLIEMTQGIEKQISYGTQQANYVGKSLYDNDFLKVAIITPRNECVIQTHLIGDYNLPNVMAAIAIGRTFAISIDTIKKAIEEYIPNNSRSQLIKKESNTIILDAYNANPTSMKLAIENFIHTNASKKVIMLGAMHEVGNNSVEEHQIVVNLLYTHTWQDVILVGGDFEKCAHSFHFFNTSEEAGEWFKNQKYENTLFLIKGSRGICMEKILN